MTDPKHISVIDQTRIPLDVKPERAPAKRRRRHRGWTTIEFEMQHQCHSSWCWAAVAASVSNFYREPPDITQCHLANIELHREDCCSVDCGVDDVEFNHPHTLPLNRIGCLELWVRDERASRTQLQRELAAGRPVCARILWSAGVAQNGQPRPAGTAGAHFVTIVGYLPGADKVAIEDPWLGPTREMSYDQLCTHYTDAGGQWADTYYTKPPAKLRGTRRHPRAGGG
jgi:hypothetical protein